MLHAGSIHMLCNVYSYVWLSIGPAAACSDVGTRSGAALCAPETGRCALLRKASDPIWSLETCSYTDLKGVWLEMIDRCFDFYDSVLPAIHWLAFLLIIFWNTFWFKDYSNSQIPSYDGNSAINSLLLDIDFIIALRIKWKPWVSTNSECFFYYPAGSVRM